MLTTSDQSGTQDASGPQPAHLKLGHVLASLGAENDPPIGLDDVLVIRHTFTPGLPDGLKGPEDLELARVISYTRRQSVLTRRFPADPPRYWVILITDGKRRSRLYGTFENRGELIELRDDEHRTFDLHSSDFLAPLVDRLVIEWNNPRSWHRRGTSATNLPVLEIADRDKVPFPGFDGVRLTFHELQELVESHRYEDWRAALREVQGIYLITDSTSGKQYVGKADGAERLLGRWSTYARDGHGGNVALRDLAFERIGDDVVRTEHARNFLFSILRVFGPSTPMSAVNAAESHFKSALMTREFGLNRG